MTNRVSLAELAAADIPLHPAEAVTLVAEICRQHACGDIPGIPSPGIIRLTRAGEVVAQGPMTREEATVSRAAHLLNDLLPGDDAPGDYRASGGLRLVIARALGTLDLPPYAGLEEFCGALARFGTSDVVGTARGLFRLWEERQAMPAPRTVAPALTISDIRRARRATGWSLDDLACAADVPAARLRELEWGYVRNWQADEEARQQIVRYARAAGLDEAVVLSIAWPLIESGSMGGIEEQAPQPVSTLVPSGPQAMATIGPPVRRRPRSAMLSSVLYAAVAALLALATLGIVMGSARGPQVNRPARAQASDPFTAQPPVPAAREKSPERQTRPLVASAAAAAPVVQSPPVSSPASVRRPRTRPVPQPRRAAARPTSFFSRELLRIDIR
jgi:hypothetical protein